MTNKRKNIKVSELAYFASDREGFKKFGSSARDTKAVEFGQNKHNSVGTQIKSFLMFRSGGGARKQSIKQSLLRLAIGIGIFWLIFDVLVQSAMFIGDKVTWLLLHT